MTETPKEFINRTIRKRLTVIVDEIGDPGVEPLDNPDFIMSSVIIDDLESFGNISKKYRELWKRAELKAKTSTSEERDTIITEIMNLDHDVHSVYIDKRADDNPVWWKSTKNRDIVYRRTLSELMNETLSKTEGAEFTIILDRHKAIIDGRGKKTIEEATPDKMKNIIDVFVSDSTGGMHRDFIQTNDYIPREARELVRGEKTTSKINMNIKRIKNKL